MVAGLARLGALGVAMATGCSLAGEGGWVRWARRVIPRTPDEGRSERLSPCNSVTAAASTWRIGEQKSALAV
jgi:hypothetical protein